MYLLFVFCKQAGSWLLCLFSGSTSYVLTTDGSYQLWNAYTGEKFDVQDANCPLKSIGCIFNQENVWSILWSYSAALLSYENVGYTGKTSTVWNFYFQSISGIFPYHGKHFHTMELDKTMKIGIKPRKHSEAPVGFEPMTSVIPVRHGFESRWSLKIFSELYL